MPPQDKSTESDRFFRTNSESNDFQSFDDPQAVNRDNTSIMLNQTGTLHPGNSPRQSTIPSSGLVNHSDQEGSSNGQMEEISREIEGATPIGSGGQAVLTVTSSGNAPAPQKDTEMADARVAAAANQKKPVLTLAQKMASAKQTGTSFDFGGEEVIFQEGEWVRVPPPLADSEDGKASTSQSVQADPGTEDAVDESTTRYKLRARQQQNKAEEIEDNPRYAHLKVDREANLKKLAAEQRIAQKANALEAKRKEAHLKKVAKDLKILHQEHNEKVRIIRDQAIREWQASPDYAGVALPPLPLTSNDSSDIAAAGSGVDNPIDPTSSSPNTYASAADVSRNNASTPVDTNSAVADVVGTIPSTAADVLSAHPSSAADVVGTIPSAAADVLSAHPSTAANVSSPDNTSTLAENDNDPTSGVVNSEKSLKRKRSDGD